MRDDNTVSTFRVRTFWFKLLLFLFLLLLVVCGLGSYGSVYYKGKYDATLQKNEKLEAELSEIRVLLQDRTNLAILPGDIGGQTGETVASGDMVRQVTPGNEAGTATSSIETIASSRNMAGGQGANPDQGDAQVAPTPEGGANSAVTVPSPEEMEAHPIRISNVSVTYEAGKRVQIVYDIANQPQKEVLSGNCAIYAVTKQGDVRELETAVRNSLTFRIRIFRKITAALKMPDGLNKADIENLRFVVKVPGLPDYVKDFPPGV